MMKTVSVVFLATGLLTCAAALATGSAATAMTPNPDAPRASINDLAWFAGHWEGDAGETHLEQFCSQPARRMIMCMVRFTDPQQTTGMEFVTLEEKAEGIEERIRFFDPGLEEREGAKPVMLRLVKFSTAELVFENPETSKPGPRRVTLTRSGSDDIGVHIEVFDEKNQTRSIDARWRRAK